MRIFSRRHRAALLALATLLTLTACGGGEGQDADSAGEDPAKALEVAAPALGEGCGEHRPVIDDEIQPSFFGMHVHRLAHAEKPTAWPSIPVGSLRLWDSGVTWKSLQPAPDTWRLDALDKHVDLALANGASVLSVLGGGVPPWASSDPSKKSPQGGGAIAAPRVDAWRDYVRMLAERYKGRICAYEIWNEPNLDNFYAGTPEELAQLTIEASKIIKSVDPDALVVSPGVSARSGDMAWLDRYFQGDVANHIDVIGVHLYPYPEDVIEDVIPAMYGVRDLIARKGLEDKPVWNTEGALGVAAGGKEHTPIAGPDADAQMVRFHLVSLAAGIDSVYWYAWNNRVFGGLYLVEEDLATPTPAASSYELAYSWVVGARPPACENDGATGIWSCTLEHGGWSGLALWHSGEGRTPAPDGFVHICTVDGQGRALEPGEELTVTASPILLVDKAGCPSVEARGAS